MRNVTMRLSLQSTAALAGLALAAATGAAWAHHSFAMFDMEHPIEISGTVKEFKFVSPHTLLILQVKGEDGVVKYTSAHVDYAESEFIVRSGHSCQMNPLTIEEVRRILLLNLGEDKPVK